MGFMALINYFFGNWVFMLVAILGFFSILFGFSLNILVMARNGWKMPVSKTAYRTRDRNKKLPSEHYSFINEGTELKFLADTILVRSLNRVISVGDIFIYSIYVFFCVSLVGILISAFKFLISLF